MEPWLVTVMVLLALGLGAVLGYLGAVARSAPAAAELRAELSAATARAELLEHTAEELRERADEEEDVLRALAPVRASLDRVGAQVAELERERSTQYGALRQQLHLSQESAEHLRRATSGLESALRSTSARGHWGEVELRRVLEAAGMLRHVDFAEQRTLANGTRPDVVVRLPGGRTVPIDAKVPLDAHLKAEALAAEAPDQVEKLEGLRAEHARAVRAHIDALASRDYHADADVTVMFLPAESLLSSALGADPGLLDHAFARGIVPASPTSLLALLRATANIWMQHDLTDQAEDLLRVGRTLYQRLGTLAGHMTTLGNSITSTVAAYNKAVGSLESRLLVTAREFESLEAPPKVSGIHPDKAQVRRLTAGELAS